MSYQRVTFISGKNKEGRFRCTHRSGHWNLNSAINAGRKYGIVDAMEIEHTVFDNSGHGRGGHDGRWMISADNEIGPKQHETHDDELHHMAMDDEINQLY